MISLTGGHSIEDIIIYFSSANIICMGDIIISGEGEETYKKLIEYKITNINMENRNNKVYELDKISGLYYRSGEEIVFTGKRDVIDINEVKRFINKKLN